MKIVILAGGVGTRLWPMSHAEKPKQLLNDADVLSAIQAAEKTLGDQGRVLLRASGTEFCVRVMVEADDLALSRCTAEKLAGVVSARMENAANDGQSVLERSCTDFR